LPQPPAIGNADAAPSAILAAIFAAATGSAYSAPVELSIREAAAVLGKSERMVRHLASTGRIAARRDGKRWFIDGDKLGAVADAQRDQVEVVRERVNRTLDRAAPAPSGTAEKRAFYSARDLDAHRSAAAAIVAVTKLGAAHPEARAALDAPTSALRAFLRALTDGCHQFHPQSKIDRFIRARSLLAEAIADLVCFNLLQAEPDVTSLVDGLERDTLGAMRGLLRRAEKRRA
jgi:hypothetical protein